MRTGFILGILSFVPLLLFEWLRCRDYQQGRNRKNPLFLIGLGMLTAGWLRMLTASSGAPGIQYIVGIAAAVLGIASYIYVLSAVAVKGTYTKNEGSTSVIQSGVYGYVRHPGVWCFLLVSIGSGIAYPKTFVPAMIFAGLNLIYTIVQDRWFFPVTLAGYEKYREKVPFLFPHKCGHKNKKT